MMSAGMYIGGGIYNEFRYHYVGPNSDNSMSTTAFLTEGGAWEHTIGNIQIDGEMLKFNGDIFMGRIEEKVQL